jgi:hypothetical protein
MPSQSSSLTTIYNNAKDQLRTKAKNRYGKKNGITNLASDVSMLMRAINTENKHVDTLYTVSTCTAAAPFILLITPPAEGSDSNNRTGRSIKVDRIDFVANFTWNGGTGASTTITTQVFKYFILQYLKTQNSTAPALNDFLNLDANTQTSVLSLPNTDLSDFKVLHSGEVNVICPASNTQSSVVVDLSIPCQFHQTFAGTTAASISDNCCFLACVAMVTSGTGGASAITPQLRMWYIDN